MFWRTSAKVQASCWAWAIGPVSSRVSGLEFAAPVASFRHRPSFVSGWEPATHANVMAVFIGYLVPKAA